MPDTSLTEYRQQLPEQFSEAQLAYLQARTPKAFVKYREGRGGNYPYVEIGYVQLMLNTVFGNGAWDWEYELVQPLSFPNTKQIVVSGKLTVRVHNKESGAVLATITKTASGGGPIKYNTASKEPMDLADDVKSASADALKKAASYLGIAADIYAPKVYAVFEAGRKAKNKSVSTVQVIDEETEAQIEHMDEDQTVINEKELHNQLLRRLFALADRINKQAFNAKWITFNDEQKKEAIKEALDKNGLTIKSFGQASNEELQKAIDLLDPNNNPAQN